MLYLHCFLDPALQSRYDEHYKNDLRTCLELLL